MIGNMTAEPKQTANKDALKTGEAYVDPSILAESDTEKLSAELAETKDKLLRAMAEIENQRRRFERELKDTASYSIAKFATDMLGIADNLRRALEASPPEIKTDKIAAPLLKASRSPSGRCYRRSSVTASSRSRRWGVNSTRICIRRCMRSRAKPSPAPSCMKCRRAIPSATHLAPGHGRRRQSQMRQRSNSQCSISACSNMRRSVFSL